MKLIKLPTLSVSALFLLGACSATTLNSSDVKSHVVFRDYDVTYREDTKTLEANADLKAGGSGGDHLNLEGKASILFDSAGMHASRWLVGGRYYSQKQANADVAFRNADMITKKFTYTDSDGKTSETPVQIKKIVIKAMPNSIDASKAFSVNYFIPAPLSPEDQVKISMTQSKAADTTEEPLDFIQTVKAQKAGSISIPAYEIAQLRKRPATITVSLYSRKRIQDGATDQPASVQAEYVVAPVNKDVQ